MPPPDDMEDYFNKGLKPNAPGPLQTPDAKQISFLNAVMNSGNTFAKNVLNTATFHGADHIASWLTGQPVEDIRRRGAELDAENPKSAMAGKGAGVLGQMALTGGGLGTLAARGALPYAGAVSRALTSGTLEGGAAGMGLTAATAAGLNAATDNLWGARAGKVTALDAAKEIALGGIGGASGGYAANALVGPAITRAGAQIPTAIVRAVEQRANPANLERYGLTGDAAPNLPQLLNMVGGEAKASVAPRINTMFEKAAKGESDSMFPALRINREAQFPEKTDTANWRGSFAQRAEAAAANAKDAAKGVEKGVERTPVRAASFLPQDIRDTTRMLRDAAINKKAANPEIPHAQEARFLQEAAKREADPAVAARAEGLVNRIDPTLERRANAIFQDLDFKTMMRNLQPGPTSAGPSTVPVGAGRNLNLRVPGVTEVVDFLKNTAGNMARKRSFNEVREAAAPMVTDPVRAAAELGVRTPKQTAAGSLGVPVSQMLLNNLLHKLQLMPDGTPRE